MKDLLATIELYDDDDTRVGLNNGSDFNRNPKGVNQFTKNMRTADEIQKAIDNAPPKIIEGKEYPLTRKDLRGEGKFYSKKLQVEKN